MNDEFKATVYVEDFDEQAMLEVFVSEKSTILELKLKEKVS